MPHVSDFYWCPNRKKFPITSLSIQTERQSMFSFKCLQIYNYADERKALKMEERALKNRHEREMDRQKCQHGADKVFERE